MKKEKEKKDSKATGDKKRSLSLSLAKNKKSSNSNTAPGSIAAALDEIDQNPLLSPSSAQANMMTIRGRKISSSNGSAQYVIRDLILAERNYFKDWSLITVLTTEMKC